MFTIKSRLKITAAFLALLLLTAALLPLTAQAAGTTITEYPVLTAGSGPVGITTGPDGALWFTEWNGNQIGRINPSTHAVTEYPVLTAGSRPWEITSGPDGALWFTEAKGNKIGRIDPTTHVVAEYPVLTAGSYPVGITTGPDHALWFTEHDGDKIGRINPTTHAVTEYTVPTAGSEPAGITSGPDGALWFTEANGNKIGRIDPTTHTVTEYGLTAYSDPEQITSGTDGALWFTEWGSSKIGRIDPSTHAVTEYPVPTGDSRPYGITSGTDGALWFTEYNGDRIGRIDPSTHAMTEYGLTAGSVPYGIASGPDGALWFTEDLGDKIGRIAVSPSPSSFYFAEGTTRTNFQEYLTLGNSNSSAATANVTYMFTNGTTKEANYTVPANSRYTVNVNSVVGPNQDLSLDVLSESPNLVAERPMYFNYNGVWTGGSDAIGAVAPNTKWYFAEGNTLPEFDQYVTVLNPGSTKADLTFHYMVEGKGEKVTTGSVEAHSRATFKTRDQIGSNLNASLYLSSTQNVVAERPMYFDYNSWTGGHDVVGANSPSSAWYFAEGTTRYNFNQWLCLQNPGKSKITIKARYLLGSGQGKPIVKTYTVKAKQRLTVNVNAEIGANKDNSVELTSKDNFIAERPMYFNYYGNWTGGHDVLGANKASTSWSFAEGTTRDNFNEWLCLQNPGSSDTHIVITYYTTSGQAIRKGRTVKANSRLTVNVNQDAGANLDISAKVTSDRPIIVERPMYFNYNGWTGGHDVVGLRK